MDDVSSFIVQAQKNRSLVNSFNQKLNDFHSMTRDENPNETIKCLPSDAAQKRKGPIPLITACLPIGAAALKLNVTHRKRVLRLTVAVAEPLVTIGVTLLLLDENGDMVRLGVYNIIPEGSFTYRAAAAKEMFPLGRLVAILEPFYKIWLDGGTGVRVDDPSEVLFLDTLGPQDVAGLHEEGNALFRAGHTADAALTYTRAIHMRLTSGEAKDTIISRLLSVSACMVLNKNHGHALACATTAITLDPACVQAFMQAALALDAMSQHLCASWFMKEAVSRSGFSQGSLQGKEMMGKLSPTAAAAKTADWLHDVLPIVTSEVVDSVNVFSGPLFSVEMVGGSVVDAVTAEHDEAVVSNVFNVRGNQLLQAGKVNEATEHYKGALAAMPLHRRKVCILLANRASCSLQLGMKGTPKVMADSCAAIVLDFKAPKSYHRVACVLKDLGALQPALDFARTGLGLAPGHKELAGLVKRLSGMNGAAASV